VGRAIPIQGIVIDRDVAFPWIQWTTRHAQLRSRSLPTNFQYPPRSSRHQWTPVRSGGQHVGTCC
jgi:hypothetical protein